MFILVGVYVIHVKRIMIRINLARRYDHVVLRCIRISIKCSSVAIYHLISQRIQF